MSAFLNPESWGMTGNIFSDATALVKNDYMQNLLSALKMNA